jgi:hypothetical protein
MPEGRIERWVLVIAEELACPCHGSVEIAKKLQGAVDERRKERRNGGRRTWLTPYDEIYADVMGGDHPDLGPLMKPAGRAETTMRKSDDGEAGAEAAAERAHRSFRNFCWAYRDRREYIPSWSKWADNVRYWYEQTRERRVPL